VGEVLDAVAEAEPVEVLAYPHHVLLAYPAPHLALAAALVEGAELVRGRRRIAAAALGAAALVASVAVSVTTTTDMLSRLRETGGTLVALSDGHLRGTELWDELNAKGRVRGSCLEQLDDPSASYVLHAADATSFPRAWHRFLERRVLTRLGHPLFEVYRVS
jgi:hypothetical protein